VSHWVQQYRQIPSLELAFPSPVAFQGSGDMVSIFIFTMSVPTKSCMPVANRSIFVKIRFTNFLYCSFGKSFCSSTIPFDLMTSNEKLEVIKSKGVRMCVGNYRWLCHGLSYRCHSKVTRAPIANPPSSAQLGDIACHFP